MRSNILFACGLLVLSCKLYAQSPGGVSNEAFWLKGNSSSENSERRTLNFNPAIETNDGRAIFKFPASVSSLKRVTVFTVYKNPSLADETQVWGITSDFGDLSLSTRQLVSKRRELNMVFEKSKQQPAAAFIHTYSGRGAFAENAGNSKTFIRFGSLKTPSADDKTTGLVAEFILYEKILGEEDVTKIETYLALKYGITLQKNYLNSLGETVWNFKNDNSFSNNIAGLARDDRSALYQKQSTSAGTDVPLVISVDRITELNRNNTGSINNGDYLVWGDNAGSFRLEENTGYDAGAILLSEKKWLIRPTGNSASKLLTQLTIDAKPLLAGRSTKDSFCLAIDRTGTGEFIAGQYTYIPADSISRDGIASFSGLNWDADGSGKDAFTFGLKSALAKAHANNTQATGLTSFQLYPNPVKNGRFKMTVTLDKVADIQVRIYDIQQRLVFSGKGAGQSSYIFPAHIKGAAGSYTVKLVTPDKEYSRIIILQ